MKAHKLFVSEAGGFVYVEMVTDDQPPLRLQLVVSADEARDIAETFAGAVAQSHPPAFRDSRNAQGDAIGPEITGSGP